MNEKEPRGAPIELRLGFAEARAIYEAASEGAPSDPPLAYQTAMRKLQAARYPNTPPDRNVLDRFKR